MCGWDRVALKDGGPVVRIRTIIRVPDSDKWSSDSNSKGGCDSQAAKPVQQGAERHEEHARYEGHRPRRRWVHTARDRRPGTERPQSKRLPHHSRNPVEVWLYQRMRRMRSENIWHQAAKFARKRRQTSYSLCALSHIPNIVVFPHVRCVKTNSSELSHYLLLSCCPLIVCELSVVLWLALPMLSGAMNCRFGKC